MPENVVEILNKITAAKGEAFAEGFVAGVNLVTPEDPKKSEAKSQPG